MLQTPCSQSIMYELKQNGLKKKSTIAILEDEKKRRGSVIDPKPESVFIPVQSHPSNEKLNELSKSIVFPKHTMKRINDEDAGELNTTLHIMQQNCGADADQPGKDTSMVDFGADVSQIMGESSFCQPKMVPALSAERMFSSCPEKELAKRSKKLFEDFLVISATKEAVRGTVLEGREAFKPEILWEFLEESETSNA